MLDLVLAVQRLLLRSRQLCELTTAERSNQEVRDQVTVLSSTDSLFHYHCSDHIQRGDSLDSSEQLE